MRTCHRGLRRCSVATATDADVFERAFAEDRIVVTINVGDFEKLAKACQLHAGLVLIEPSGLSRDEQLTVVFQAVLRIFARGDLVNTVLRVAAHGSMTFEALPPSS